VRSLNEQIWRGLVNYANEPLIEPGNEALKGLAEACWNSMGWMVRTAFDFDQNEVQQMIAQQIQPALGAFSMGRPPWVFLKSGKDLEDEFHRQAVQYQPDVRQMLRWLADPKRNAHDRDKGFAFLREHSDHIEFQRGDPAFAPEDQQSRYFDAHGELRTDADFPYRSFRFKDIADVICDFVQREHEAGKSLPVGICKRPGCGNPIVKAKKREFCRSAFCDKERQKRDDGDDQRKNRDRVFLHRIRQMPPGTRREKIHKDSSRLREIESYWRDKNERLAKSSRNLIRQFA
jgi:hypothetical protein